MKVMTQREAIRTVPGRFKEQYAHYPAKFQFKKDGKTVSEIQAALDAMNLETCSAADIDRAIGISGWASIDCDECRQPADRVVRVGNDGDEERWQDLCEACLSKAIAMLREP